MSLQENPDGRSKRLPCPTKAESLPQQTFPPMLSWLHFAEENPIFLDVETPLASFGGKTAFEVAGEAMLCHESQLQYAHRPTLASEEFPRYDCRRFGLVRSLVGADTGNDIMEHLC